MKWAHQKIPILKPPGVLASSWRLFDIQARAVSNKTLSPKEVVIMTMSIRKMVVVGLCVVVALFVASPIQGKDKVKITGAELDKLLLKPGAISFGITHKPNWVWIVEALEDGKRSVYWRSLANPIVWGTDIGSTKIVGDQLCERWTFGPERCLDIYRVGGDKYESWLDGTLFSTWYRGQREYEPRKDKVKITGAELKERESQYGVFAGVDQRRGSVWIIIDYDGGKRELYWRSSMMPGLSGSWTGIGRIVGDERCTKWIFGPERCYDIYRIGEDKYESWLGGMISSSYYRLK